MSNQNVMCDDPECPIDEGLYVGGTFNLKLCDEVSVCVVIVGSYRACMRSIGVGWIVQALSSDDLKLLQEHFLCKGATAFPASGRDLSIIK